MSEPTPKEPVMREERVEALVVSAKRVLKAFRAGRNPTFDQLGCLEGALMYFTDDLLCGHKPSEECDCAEEFGARPIR